MNRVVSFFFLVAVVYSGFGEAAWPFGSQPSPQPGPPPCPGPAQCPLIGTWLGESGALRLEIEKSGNHSLHVEYTLRDIVMEGKIQTSGKEKAVISAAEVLLATSTTPVTCLLTILACHQGHLWVTELPLEGHASAVTYALHPPQKAAHGSSIAPAQNASGTGSDRFSEIVIQIALKNYTDSGFTHAKNITHKH